MEVAVKAKTGTISTIPASSVILLVPSMFSQHQPYKRVKKVKKPVTSGTNLSKTGVVWTMTAPMTSHPLKNKLLQLQL
jgi:hypothetical protein